MEISLHSKIKHRILAYYYGALKKVIRYFWNWYYVDLFSGDGVCECVDIPNHILALLDEKTDKIYPPPFFNLLDYAKEMDGSRLNMKFIFNDFDVEQKNRLEKTLSSYKKYVLDVGNQDANKYYEQAIQLIKDPNRPSLFYLDPTNHKDLKFSTIKRISEFKGTDGRKPELIINLMVFSMLKAVERKDYTPINESLGTDSWLSQLEEYKSKNKTHELFLDVFTKQLEKLGYRTTEYLVSSTVTKSPIYYLIFCACNDKIYSIHKNIELNVKKLQEEAWVKETTTIAYRIKKIPIDQKTLKF